MKSCKTLCHAMIRIAQLSLMVSFSSISQGQDTFIYLEKVQGMEEQEMDKLDCYNWAKIQSGFDLMHAPIATPPPPLQKPRQSGLIHGAGRGATVGAISGAIGGKAGKGATTGSFIGGIRRQDQTMRGEQQQDQDVDQQAVQVQQRHGTTNRAYSACIEAHGYTVK